MSVYEAVGMIKEDYGVEGFDGAANKLLADTLAAVIFVHCGVVNKASVAVVAGHNGANDAVVNQSHKTHTGISVKVFTKVCSRIIGTDTNVGSAAPKSHNLFVIIKLHSSYFHKNIAPSIHNLILSLYGGRENI